eukprot:scaffold435_cov342-Pavlova_lutheri.AAC.51
MGRCGLLFGSLVTSEVRSPRRLYPATSAFAFCDQVQPQGNCPACFAARLADRKDDTGPCHRWTVRCLARLDVRVLPTATFPP